MNSVSTELLKKNPKIDQKVVSAVDTLWKKLPESERPKQGSDYNLSPPFGGQLLTIVLCGKDIR